MGSGILKTLPSYKVSYDQFLYIFFCGCHSSKPCIRLLLQSLSGRSCSDYLFFIADALIVDHRILSLAWMQCPILSVIGSIPGMLRAVAAQVSLFVTCIALN